MGSGDGWSKLEQQSGRGRLLTWLGVVHSSCKSLYNHLAVHRPQLGVDSDPVSISLSPRMLCKRANAQQMWQDCAKSSLGQWE